MIISWNGLIVVCICFQMPGHWRHWWQMYTTIRPFHEIIVQMSEYSLVGNYSLVGCCTLILHDVIDGRYVEMGNLSCMSLLLLLYIYNTTKKKVYKDLHFSNPVGILRHTIHEINNFVCVLPILFSIYLTLHFCPSKFSAEYMWFPSGVGILHIRWIQVSR